MVIPIVRDPKSTSRYCTYYNEERGRERADCTGRETQSHIYYHQPRCYMI